VIYIPGHATVISLFILQSSVSLTISESFTIFMMFVFNCCPLQYCNTSLVLSEISGSHGTAMSVKMSSGLLRRVVS
jgi:hypothetical protein